MARTTDADALLEETLARQREMIRFLRRAKKETDDDGCERLFAHLAGVTDDQMTDAAAELARRRMERRLGRAGGE